jgi:hypothetical protein
VQVRYGNPDGVFSRTLKRFERKMDEIKRLARDIVKPLMRNFLELELKIYIFNAGAS